MIKNEGGIIMKKSISLCMMLILVISLVLSGCTKTGDQSKEQTSTNKDAQATTAKALDNLNKEGFPIVKEQVTLKVLTVDDGDRSPEEAVLYQDLEKLTNINIEWTVVTRNAWKEKKGILFANNDLPDIILGNQTLTDQDILNYGRQGLIIPIDDLYEEYGFYMKEAYKEHPDVKKMVTASDGKMYSFPEFDRGFPITTRFPLFMNKSWLEAVGMEIPTTTEEFYQVLKAFKEQDPNGNGEQDEIPLSFSQDIMDLFGSFGLTEDNKTTHLTVQDGKVVYTLATPQYKEGMNYFQRLYAEGLIDEEAFTQDGGMLTGKIKSETRIVGAFQTWRSSGYKRTPDDAMDEYVPVPPMAGPDGTRLWPLMQAGGSRGAGVITNKCENPEIAMRWLDSLYEPEWAVQVGLMYYMGVHMVKEGDNFKIIRKPERDILEDSQYFSGARIFNVRNSTGSRFLERPAHIMEKQELDKVYAPYYPKEVYPKNTFLSQEESEELSEFAVDINNYADEMFAKWMTVGGIEDEWEGYLKTLKDMGLERYLAIYQGAYERYMQAN